MERTMLQSEVKEFDGRDLTVVHFISTERRDRGNDVLYADGMTMQGKPVVLFQHGQGSPGSEPIAKPLWIKKGEFNGKSGIKAKTQFYPDDLGKRLWKKTTEGYMPNWSVGWRPIRQESKTERDGTLVRHVYEWELLEYSIVAVPMQADAQTMGDKVVGQLNFKILNDRIAKQFVIDGWETNERGFKIIVEGILTRVIADAVKKELKR